MIDQLVREARPEIAPPDPTTVLRARRALLRRAAAGRVRRRRLRIAIAISAATAMTAVVIGVVQTPDHGASPAAAALLEQSATQLETAAAPAGSYTYRHLIQMGWAYGPSASDPARASTEPWVNDSVETWVPTDPGEPLVQRTTEDDGTRTFAVVPQQDNEAYSLIRANRAPAQLLDALREYAHRIGNEGDDGTWGSAAQLLIEPYVPDDLRADVLRALARLDGVTTVEGQVEIGGRTGIALRYPEKYPLDLVFDPADGSFLGVRGAMEPDDDWIGPDRPFWVSYLETKTVDSLPRLPARLRD